MAGGDSILVLNCGSSSIKFALFTRGDRPARLMSGAATGIGGPARLRCNDGRGEPLFDAAIDAPDHGAIFGLVLERIEAIATTAPIAAVGHRVVHGGERYAVPVRVDGAVEADLRNLIPLAPLHLGINLAGIAAVRARCPALPQVACFDTAFHRTLPPVARETGLPRRYTDAGIRRYGFHGLSYESVVATLRTQEGEDAVAGRLIVAHLGSGASMTAIRAGRSLDTTMGFSALDGLLMGTRCGDLDPGVLLHLLREQGMDRAVLEKMLYTESGLLGVSAVSADMRVLLAREADLPAAALAVELFCMRVRKHLGALTAVLAGLDRLIFTGGIGEHAAAVRARISADLDYLGIVLDPERNARSARTISVDEAPVRVQVIPTDEEAVIAAHTESLLAQRGSGL
ncbi:MAG: acetate/propionate family kinase [Gammaproteobacteria bacterium]|nr:acetate/propionate family kinase [Gammaproteobacteria bacterium]